ncbi:probable G-protein coupled receptor 139 [Hypanus sabinus]|uniref:probable G-protein coupled receptor 139 n=1 Tax=Hypanus sabinus TaxID=79690 RepID=UPI0028C3E7FC|nr:probable G-protein coupled receptor 139 [Hypanus sabinus]
MIPYFLSVTLLALLFATDMLMFPSIPTVNVLTIVVLSRRKCGLSKGITRYLLAMAAADLLVVILDLVLRQIPIVYWEAFHFLSNIRVCNVHAVLLYAANDCSVWFTVMFTFDRFVAISSHNLKAKYCTERTAAAVLGTVAALSCLKNIFWYYMFSGAYRMSNTPWFCLIRSAAVFSVTWTVVEYGSYLLTPIIPFVVILLLNTLTIRHVLVASRARRRLRSCNSGDSSKDSEMVNRRKAIILLLVVSANFIMLWMLYVVCTVWIRLVYISRTALMTVMTEITSPPIFILELGYMLQLLSCCTNTALYALTQKKFWEQMLEVVKFPFTLIVRETIRNEEYETGATHQVERD